MNLACAFLLWGVVAAGEVTVTSSTCAVTFDGARIAQVRNLATGDLLAAEGGEFQILDARGNPVALNAVTVERRNGGAIISAASERGDCLAVTVHADGEDVCLRFDAEVAEPGLRAISFVIKDFRGATTFIAPILGGMALTPETPVNGVEHMYPGNWQSQFAILQSQAGGVWVRSTDTAFGFKHVKFARNGSLSTIVFRDEAQAPFTQHRRFVSPEWRIAAYKGDWRIPAGRYREWMARAFDLQPFEPGSWEDGIRCVVTTSIGGITERGLGLLAARVRPAQTLLYIPSWRTHAYDVMYPDYEPEEGAVGLVRAARHLGFHVMLHVDMPGVTGAHSFFEEVRAHQLRDAVTLEPIGWWLDKHLPQSFYFINPASPVFRAEFVRRMQDIAAALPANAIHLDVSAPTWNDGNGFIDGMSYPQGAARLHEDLVRALPDVVWGGEHLTESTLRRERFWQLWGDHPANRFQHPITTALYWPYCRAYGYLGMPDPALGAEHYERYLRQHDRNGVIVTIPISNLESELDAVNPILDVLFDLARIHQDSRLVPDLDATAANGDYICWRNDAATLRTERRDEIMASVYNGETVFAHTSGAKSTPGLFPAGPWPAWNRHGAFGLDPHRAMLLTPQRPPVPPFHIRRIEGSAAMVQRVAAYPGATVLILAPYPPEPLVRLAEGFSEAETFTRREGVLRPLEDGAVCQFEERSCGGVMRRAMYVVPPWKKDVRGWTTGARFLVDAPGRAELRFAIGIDDEARETDGATFLASVNGEQRFKRHYSGRQWEEVVIPLDDLTPGAVTLELATHPGPADDAAWDLGLFAEPGLYAGTEPSPGPTTLTFRAGSRSYGEIIGASRTGRHRLEVPARSAGAIVLFEEDVAECETPLDLVGAGLPACIEQAVGATPGSVWHAGEVMKKCSGGEERRALFAHPPAGGRTVFPWIGRLPEGVSHLRFGAGIADGANTDGVTFEVRINGDSVWQRLTTGPGWHDDAIDLAPLAGDAIVLELVTDSGRTNHCDWACWSRAVIE